MLNRKILSLVFLLVLMTGCASVSSTDYMMKPAALSAVNTELYRSTDKPAQATVFNLLNEPVDAVAVKETPAMVQNRYSVYEVPMPMELLKGEWRERRVKWYALVVDQTTKKTSLAQLVLPPRETDMKVEHFNGKWRLMGWLIADGNQSDLANAKVIVLSTRLTQGFDLGSAEKAFPVDAAKLVADAIYQQTLVLEKGTLVANLKPASQVKVVINQWFRYESERGYLLTPWTTAELMELAALNPAYSSSQKYEEYANKSIVSDPIGLAIGTGMDVFLTLRGKTRGWDFESDNPQARKKREEIIDALMTRLVAGVFRE